MRLGAADIGCTAGAAASGAPPFKKTRKSAVRSNQVSFVELNKSCAAVTSRGKTCAPRRGSS
jgi:hypothetical protein